MMMTTAFSLVIVTLEEGTDAQSVCDDFEKNLDWRRWVCVAPSNAFIAQKGNQVLCLMAGGQLYDSIAQSIRQTGWTQIKALTNPDM